jgi:hypothetical protein
MQVSREESRRVEAALGQVVPAGACQNLGIDFGLPEDFEGLALGVVVEAREPNQGSVVWGGRRSNVFDKILPLAGVNDVTNFREMSRFQHYATDPGWKKSCVGLQESTDYALPRIGMLLRSAVNSGRVGSIYPY